MAIFNRNDSNTGSASATTVVAYGANLEGMFRFDCNLHVDGVIEGHVISSATVTVGKSGVIKGDVVAKRFILNGEFTGELQSDVVDLLQASRFTGKITSKQLLIEAGAKFNGQNSVVDDSFENQKEIVLIENNDEE